jgi:hypothetical protein
MRNFSKRDLRHALAAVIAVLVLSTDTASAQYYYPYGDRYYGYDRRDDYDYIRRAPLRRDMDSYLRDRRPVIRDNDDDVQSRKLRRGVEKKADAKNVADAPTRGPYHIFISIKHQRLALYGADGLIRTAPVSTGMQGHPTPAGVFTVIGKEIFHRSNIYSNAPMPLMQRITWSGVAIHQGVLPGYPASHGCIRMNGEFAQFLWKTTKIGARVIIAYDDPPAPIQISSPKLFTPVKNPTEHLTPSTVFAKPNISEAKRLVRTAEKAELEANTISNDAQRKTVYFKPPLMVPRSGPVSVFISRKTGKVHVRYASTPLFEMPVKIERPEQLIGTHIFTAMEVANDGKETRWVVTSLATSSAIDPAAPKKNSRDRVVADLSNMPILNSEPQTAANALNRIELPKEVMERVPEILTPGSTLIISDYGISDETGQETDFIILTR